MTMLARTAGRITAILGGAVTACSLLIDPSELTQGRGSDGPSTFNSFDGSSNDSGGTGGTLGDAADVTEWTDAGPDGDIDAEVDGATDAKADAGQQDSAPPDATDACTWYRDSDEDGFGDPAVSVTNCDQPQGYVKNDEDCDDSDPESHPGGTERCDGADNDCNPATSDGCPTLCTGFADRGQAYMVCATPVSWDEAAQACQAQGQRLVQIDDAEENAWLVEKLSGLDYAWIGGTDAEQEGIWKWPDGDVFFENGVSVGYSSWAANEPNNANGIEHCGELWVGGYWNDYDCAYPQAFICERAPSSE